LRLLLDEMYSPAIAAELRARGHDAVSVHDLGRGLVTGASDADVLAAAQREGPALVTENVRDYRPLESGLLADRSHHAGLVYTSNRQFPRGDPATLGRLVRALEALLREGQDLRDRSIFLARCDA
jgi:Domain of unknown function (DUF5615)